MDHYLDTRLIVCVYFSLFYLFSVVCTMSPKNCVIVVCFLNDSVKLWPILIIVGMQRNEGT